MLEELLLLVVGLVLWLTLRRRNLIMPRALTFTPRDEKTQKASPLNTLFRTYGLGPIPDEEVDRKYKDLVQQVASILMSNSWAEVHSSSNVRVFTDLPYAFRTEADLLAVDLDAAIPLLTEHESRQEWDFSLESRVLVKKLDASTEIDLVRVQTMWPLSVRDAVLLVHRHKFSNGAFILASRSASKEEHDYPETDAVRMHVWMAAEMCIPTSEHSFRLLQIFNADPKGYLPPTVIQRAISTIVPESMDRLLRILRREQAIPIIEQEDVAGQLLMLMQRLEQLERRLASAERESRFSWTSLVAKLSPIAISSTALILVLKFLQSHRNSRSQ